MKKLIAALSLLPLATWAAPETYQIDPSHTYPQFEVSHLGFSLQRGNFETVSGQIVLDREAKTGSIDVKIDTSSLDTGWPKRDDHLKSADFFNVAQFPTITYKAEQLEWSGDQLVAANGTLTLLGVSKPVKLAISQFLSANHPMSKKPACGGEASARIKRSEFGMKTYLPAIGDDVTLRIQVEAGQ